MRATDRTTSASIASHPPIPDGVRKSGLWKVVATDSRLVTALEGLRGIAASLGAKVSETLPAFTDHSVTHMDALWEVTDQVFTSDELSRFSVGEAFVLAASFYVHDLGMAIGATEDGRKRLESSDTYASVKTRLMHGGVMKEFEAAGIALQVSARELHADIAETLLDEPVPGVGRYLLEDAEVRSRWASFIGQVSASHHWSLRKVDERLGLRGAVPDPTGGVIDLGFLACALRVVDYAHINAGRAAPLDRALRASVGDDSIVHWYAQETIVGPSRQGDLLVYASMRPVRDVDAWWIFFEMANGLNSEVHAVAEYLARRSISARRFSLEGVKGVRSPRAFSTLVEPAGFEPVDVRFRADSTERLVEILGGRSLYGDDQFAPLRELLQNGRDAIHLRIVGDESRSLAPTPGLIRVSLDRGEAFSTVSVEDNGVGMNEKVVTSYLLGIASDYWHSADFVADHSRPVADTFKPVGRFGIGFLATFMLGEDVSVQTERQNSNRLYLKLRGIGRRGALETKPSTLRPGTRVEVRVGKDRAAELRGLARIIRAQAPLLDVPIEVLENESVVVIEPNWWKAIEQEALSEFVVLRDLNATTPIRAQPEKKSQARPRYAYRGFDSLASSRKLERWPGSQPEFVSNTRRIVAHPSQGAIVLCTKGFAVSTLPMRGFFGLADLGDVPLNAARTMPLGFKADAFRAEVKADLWPLIVKATDALKDEGRVPSRYSFLASLAATYGLEILCETTLPWITVLDDIGSAILMSAADFKQTLASRDEVVFTYGSGGGPWYSDSYARSYAPAAAADALRIPVCNISGPEVGSYKDEQDVFEGQLREHFPPEYAGAGDRSQDAHFLHAVLRLVEEAWSLDSGHLQSVPFIRARRTLIGHVRRVG